MKTILHEKHFQLGARFVDFNGWEMPLYYTSILDEHRHVRNGIGVFDVSHMGRISIEGKDAEKFVDYISTNKIIGKKNNTATYTILANSLGGCVDDTIAYKVDSEHFFLIVNAGNREKDFDHLKQLQSGFDIQITHRYNDEGILSIQGPGTLALINIFFPETIGLKPFHFVKIFHLDHLFYISHTGYTGEEGVEIYAPLKIIIKIWDMLFSENEEKKILPIGLGARDTLRLEMGYALYSHELSESILASESVSAWTIKYSNHHFLGKDALIQSESSSNKKYAYGIIMDDNIIAREGFPVILNNIIIGKLTSGSYSPTLNKAIGLILISKKLNFDDEVEIEIRKKKYKAKIHPLPFYNQLRKYS